MSRQTWLADVLHDGGCAVVEVDGWTTRGSSDFAPAGVVGHHTAGPAGGGDMPSLSVLIHGRPDLAGPLANVGLGRSGTYYVIAAGRANHAGAGGWRGLTGNASVLGIEAENDGYQPWPPAQLDAYWAGSAVLLGELGAAPAMWCRHHEWRAEKPDPHDLDGDWCRAQIAAASHPPPDPEEDDMTGPLTEAKAAADFVEQLYANIAHAAPDPAGFDYWLGLLLTGTPPAQVADAFAGAFVAGA